MPNRIKKISKFFISLSYLLKCTLMALMRFIRHNPLTVKCFNLNDALRVDVRGLD